MHTAVTATPTFPTRRNSGRSTSDHDGISVPPDAINFDLPVMIAVAVACLPIFFSGHRIDRWEGGLFFAYYVIYTAYLILRSTQHELLGAFSTTLAWIVLPLTAATLLAIGLNAWRVQRR